MVLKILSTDDTIDDEELEFRDLRRIYRPHLPSVEFQGLHIVEEWTSHKTSIATLALTIAPLIVVVVSRLLYGEWDTAWTAMGSLVTLMGVGLTWWFHMGR
jgi:hypothetical protein